MANALTDFTKKREFLICMDSDGCVMDTVRIKHSTVMCPELIRVFALDDHADFITAAWDEINLHTITRGISRFESVRLVFDRLKKPRHRDPGQRGYCRLGRYRDGAFHGQPAAGAAKDRQPGPAQAAGVEQRLQPPYSGAGADV